MNNAKCKVQNEKQKNLCRSACALKGYAWHGARCLYGRSPLLKKRRGYIKSRAVFNFPKIAFGYIKHSPYGARVLKTNDELRTTNEEQIRKALLRISTVPTFFVLRSAFIKTSDYFLLGWAQMLLAPSVRFLSEAAGLLLSLPPSRKHRPRVSALKPGRFACRYRSVAEL